MAAVENHLIELLSRSERQRLIAQCALVQLEQADVLCEAGVPTRHVYFPLDSSASLMAWADGHPGLEIGMVGAEGMLGAHLALGVDTSPLRALVQIPGTARRLGAGAFRRELRRTPALRRGVGRYLYVLMGHLATSAACQRFHQIGPRLARWLLMSADRAQADRFHATHEMLAGMLGVRRVGITMAALELQRDGLIDYRRGALIVLDRGGLEAAACGCYARDCRSYATLMA